MQQWNKIKLVSYTKSNNKDSLGDYIYTETQREVYAKAQSISQTEFYQAQTAGLKPVLKFTLASERDYQNEEELIFDGVRFKITRTYIKLNDEIELTVEGGVRENVRT